MVVRVSDRMVLNKSGLWPGILYMHPKRTFLGVPIFILSISIHKHSAISLDDDRSCRSLYS
jgi:hypothetical protein